MKKIIIFGTGSFAELADYYFRTDAGYDVIGFVVTTQIKASNNTFKGKPVYSLENIRNILQPSEVDVFVAIGYRSMNLIRSDICKLVKKMGFKLTSFIHSKVTCSNNLKVGENTFIFEDNTIQPFVKIGNGVVLWSGNHIGHHSIIKDWVFITSHVVVSGHCIVEEYSFLGVNSTIVDEVIIGKKNLIGPGSIIQKSTGNEEVWVAEKAKKINRPSSFFLK